MKEKKEGDSVDTLKKGLKDWHENKEKHWFERDKLSDEPPDDLFPNYNKDDIKEMKKPTGIRVILIVVLIVGLLLLTFSYAGYIEFTTPNAVREKVIIERVVVEDDSPPDKVMQEPLVITAYYEELDENKLKILDTNCRQLSSYSDTQSAFDTNTHAVCLLRCSQAEKKFYGNRYCNAKKDLICICEEE